MSNAVFSPPLTPASQVVQRLRSDGFAVLSPEDAALWSGCALPALERLQKDWSDLPPDEYLKDGGRYRCRRHASFEVQGDSVHLVPHRAHWQPLAYNALHGGMERWFAPMRGETVQQPVWQQLLRAFAHLADGVFASDAGVPARWFVEAHQFRIDTTDGIGRPTPEAVRAVVAAAAGRRAHGARKHAHPAAAGRRPPRHPGVDLQARQFSGFGSAAFGHACLSTMAVDGLLRPVWAIERQDGTPD